MAPRSVNPFMYRPVAKKETITLGVAVGPSMTMLVIFWRLC
jgi:hypothetical protein